MKETFREMLLLICGLCLIVSAHPQTLFAQSTSGLQIKPAVIEDNVKPGDTYRFSISVTNIGDSAKTFYLSTEDIKGLDEQGLPIFASEGEPTGYELSSWMRLPTGSVALAPGETKTVELVALVPGKTSPGAHFGAIFISDRPTKPGATGSGVGFNIGSIISLTIAGDVHDQASLREFSTDKLVYGNPTVAFAAKIENLGNILVRPHGVITVSDMFGKQVGSIEVNDTLAPVFPGSVRGYAATWQSDTFAFGRYQAIGSFSYGDTEKKTISGTTSFWVLPLKPIALVLGILLAVVVCVYLMVKTYIRRKLQEMGAVNGGQDVGLYARKYQRPGSRLIVVTLVVFLICVVFLAVLFMLFA